jgi:hypothetical protein
METTPSVTFPVELGGPDCTFARHHRASGRRPMPVSIEVAEIWIARVGQDCEWKEWAIVL